MSESPGVGRNTRDLETRKWALELAVKSGMTTHRVEPEIGASVVRLAERFLKFLEPPVPQALQDAAATGGLMRTYYDPEKGETVTEVLAPGMVLLDSGGHGDTCGCPECKAAERAYYAEMMQESRKERTT